MARSETSANGQVLQSALRWRGAAVYLLSARRRIVWMNERAADEARRLRGPFEIESEVLCGADPASRTALSNARRLIRAGAPEARFNVRDRDGRPMSATALSAQTAGFAARDDEFCVVICGAPSCARDLGGCLRAAFGLTDAETDIALGLADGFSATENAARRGIRDLTIRTHLKRIYEKTGVRRQCELAVLVWRLAALAAPSAGDSPHRFIAQSAPDLRRVG